MSNLLRNSLYAAYRDSPDVLDMFDLLDWSKLSCKFQAEMDKRMDRESQNLAKSLTENPMILRYETAINQAVLACTNEIAKLLDFVTCQNSRDLN